MKKNRQERLASWKKSGKDGKENSTKDLPVRDKSGNTKKKEGSKATTILREPRVSLTSGNMEVWCGTCGCYGNHNKPNHKNAQKPGFRLADYAPNHPAVKQQAAIDSRRAAAAPAAAPAAAATPSISARTMTAAQFSTFTAKQANLLDAIKRHGSDSALGKEAQSQLSQLVKDAETHFQ